ncbi:MAG: hypothetical protein U0176_05120 [Bacteroidia bacterium]
MANYSMTTYHLDLYQSGSAYKLRVLDSNNAVQAEYDLMTASTSITLAVSGTDYVIGTATAITDEELPHKHQVGGSNSQSITDGTLVGIGLMDLRDMGKVGSFTVTYDLSCSGVRLDGKSGTYTLWIKPGESGCWDYSENNA